MNDNQVRRDRFKEHLYESLLFAFGKLLSQYDSFAQGVLMEKVGRDVCEYLGGRGYELSEAMDGGDPFSAADLFMRNGFVDSMEVEGKGCGRKASLHNVYGYQAYKELQEASQNPFASCPLNSVLRYLCRRQGRAYKRREGSFDDRTRTVHISASIDDDARQEQEELKPTALADASLLELAEKRASKLEQILKELKTLQGLLPICANCKKIRNDRGYWQRLEQYLEEHSEAKFSHGLCPDCFRELYPELNEEVEDEQPR
jgi:hypothetical protein